MSALTNEENGKLEVFASRANEIIKTAKEFDMEYYIYKNGRFLRDFKIEQNFDNEISEYYKEELNEKFGVFGEILFSIGDKFAEFADLMPYKEIDDEIVEKAEKFWDELGYKYLPYMLETLRADIQKEYDSLSDSEYKKSLKKLKKSLNKIYKNIEKNHSNLMNTITKASWIFVQVNASVSMHMLAESYSKEARKNLKELHECYDELEKLASQYQKSINNIELLSA